MVELTSLLSICNMHSVVIASFIVIVPITIEAYCSKAGANLAIFMTSFLMVIVQECITVQAEKFYQIFQTPCTHVLIIPTSSNTHLGRIKQRVRDAL